jgi:hypothetical protein
MIYEKRLTIPANTAQAAPVSTTVEVHPGVVKRVEVSFPPGPAGLAHCQIYLWERQIWPANPDSDFAGDDLQMIFDEDLDLADPPFEFDIVGWNLDDTYPHTVTVRLLILPYDRDLRTLIEALTLGPTGPVTNVEGS